MSKGIIKDFLTYRKAKGLMKKLKGISICWDVKILEDEYGRFLVIGYKYGVPEAKDITKVLELLMNQKVNIRFYYYHIDNNLEIKVEVK